MREKRMELRQSPDDVNQHEIWIGEYWGDIIGLELATRIKDRYNAHTALVFVAERVAEQMCHCLSRTRRHMCERCIARAALKLLKGDASD